MLNQNIRNCQTEIKDTKDVVSAELRQIESNFGK